ncbi:MAG TPA: HEAT repeat domain-containing protein [Terriglobia bacterium]|nr:HEAT repeat domain-containing protein [Terriglobia bacterium]
MSKAGSPAADASNSAPDAAPLPGDWAPELLDGILSSSNASAREALYDAAFAAGPDLIPQLEAALKDDRTAEFAAQCLAFFGGEKAMKTLATLVKDKRDLDLRRFYLGALGEYQDPDITQALIEAVAKSDAEPDRTVTEAAIWSLSVRSDPSLPAQLQQAASKLEDFVIRDDVDNVRQVISARAHYLASAQGRQTGGSIPEAVHTYFIAALQSPTPSARRASGAAQTAQPPPAQTEIERVTFTPDSTRALAHVTLSDAQGSANYDIVLQKEVGDWNVVSVWMNSETDKAEPKPAAKAKK